MDGKRPLRNPDIVARKEEKEALLFNPADGNMLCVNSPGGLIWDLSDGTRTPGDMAAEIADKYEVSPDKAEGDCRSYLEELEKSGFTKPLTAAKENRMRILTKQMEALEKAFVSLSRQLAAQPGKKIRLAQ